MAEILWQFQPAFNHCGWPATENTPCTVSGNHFMWCSSWDNCTFRISGFGVICYSDAHCDGLLGNQMSCDCFRCSNSGDPNFNCCSEPGHEFVTFYKGDPIGGVCHSPGEVGSWCEATGYMFESMYCDESVVCWSAIYHQINGKRNIVRGPGRIPKSISLPQADMNKPIQLIEDGIEMSSKNYLFV